MLKSLKILTVSTLIVFATSVLTINVIDAKPSQSLNQYNQKLAAHRPSQEQASIKDFVSSISTLENIKSLRLSIRKANLQCFITSTCSNKDYNESIINAGLILKKHRTVLNNFHDTLASAKGITVQKTASLKDKYFLSFSLLIKLQLIEINHLFAQSNDSKKHARNALQKALALDSFLHHSLELPNPALISVYLAVNLKWLRESIQKYSPSTVAVQALKAKEVIENMKLGEFILFSNFLNTVFKEKLSLRIYKTPQKIIPTLFFSKNRTLNLYVETLNQSASADCVKFDKNFCTVNNVKHRHLVNPTGKTLVHLNQLSPSPFKKVTNIAKKINALNL